MAILEDKPGYDFYGQQCAMCRRHQFISLVWLSVLASLSAQNTTQRLTVMLNEDGVIKSTRFPSRCCEDHKITICYDPDATKTGYLQLVFDDLDLPPGTLFRIYHNESETSLTQNQPTYRYGVWERPFIYTESSPGGVFVHLVLKSPPQNISYVKETFAGFKASYRISEDPKPYLNYTSELCGSILSVLESGEVRVKPQATTQFRDKTLNCVWVLKPPSMALSQPILGSAVYTYLRFQELRIYGTGALEVREGTHSESPLIEEGKELAQLLQPDTGFFNTRGRGYFVRAILPADDHKSVINFVYGYSYMADLLSGLCGRDQFQCNHPHEGGICLPIAHQCNNVPNCPGGEDEQNCDFTSTVLTPSTTLPTTTTMVATTTTIRTTTTPRSTCFWVDCGDGRCLLWESQCSTNIGKGGCNMFEKYCEKSDTCVSSYDLCPGECARSEKKCANGVCVPSWRYCAEDPCPVQQPNKCDDQCYSNSERCNGYTYCNDGGDEYNCPDETYTEDTDAEVLYLLLLVPVALSFVCCCALCCKWFKKTETPRVVNGVELISVLPPEGTALVTAVTHTVTTTTSTTASTMTNPSAPLISTHRSPPTRPSPAPPVNDHSEDATLPPPSYEEVAGAAYHMQNNGTGRLPPPSYESAMSGQQFV